MARNWPRANMVACLLLAAGGCGGVASGPPAAGGASPAGNAAQALQVLTEAADLVATIRDPQSLEAARPKIAALQGRFAAQRSVLTTAVYLGGELPFGDAALKQQFAEQVRTDPEFRPYLADAEALVADSRFGPTYRRYHQAVLQASQVPGATALISEAFQLASPGE